MVPLANSAAGSRMAPPRRGDDVMFVVGTLEVGGSERHISAIAQALQRRGRQISIYCLSGSGPLHAELESGGVTVLLPPVDRGIATKSLFIRMLRLSLAAAGLLLVLLRRRPAIVHFFLPEAYITGAPLAILARVRPRVMSRRSLNHYQARRPLLGRLERQLHGRMQAVLGNSASVVRDLNDEGVPPQHIGLIYNGVDLPRLAPKIDRATMRAGLGLSPPTLTITIVANLIPYKGHHDLLQALGGAKRSLPADWRLLIVGRDDGIEKELRAEAKRLDIARHVLFLGPRVDVPELLGVSDIGILCSHEEGFSNSVLEGMAAGLPMIVTNVGGNAEAVIDGECGLVVPARDPQKLGEAIIMLTHDTELRTRLGSAARQRVETHFTIEKCIDAYDELYTGLLAGKAPIEIEAIRAGVK